jgi:hypothetical protein
VEIAKGLCNGQNVDPLLSLDESIKSTRTISLLGMRKKLFTVCKIVDSI